MGCWERWREEFFPGGFVEHLWYASFSEEKKNCEGGKSSRQSSFVNEH